LRRHLVPQPRGGAGIGETQGRAVGLGAAGVVSDPEPDDGRGGRPRAVAVRATPGDPAERRVSTFHPHLLERRLRLTRTVVLGAWAALGLLIRYRRTPYLPITVLPNATCDVVSALEERRVIFPGLLIQAEPKRHYPDSSVVAHLVGYVGEITETERAQRRFAAVRLGGLLGKGGLERQYDDSLRGADGVRFVEVSALGRVVREGGTASRLPPVPGRAVHTTIDLDLQRYIAQIFPAGQRGAVLAMNPNTGEILALYSAPG